MKWLLTSALLLACGLAQAQGQTQGQAVWRCGPDGRSYSDSPCPQGRQVEVGDSRSAEAVAAGRQVAAMDERLASQMAADREQRAREQRAQGNGLAAIGTTGLLKPAEPGSAPRALAKPQKVAKPPRAKLAKAAKKAKPPADTGTSRTAARGSRQKPG